MKEPNGLKKGQVFAAGTEDFVIRTSKLPHHCARIRQAYSRQCCQGVEPLRIRVAVPQADHPIARPAGRQVSTVTHGHRPDPGIHCTARRRKRGGGILPYTAGIAAARSSRRNAGMGSSVPKWKQAVPLEGQWRWLCLQLTRTVAERRQGNTVGGTKGRCG